MTKIQIVSAYKMCLALTICTKRLINVSTAYYFTRWFFELLTQIQIVSAYYWHIPVHVSINVQFLVFCPEFSLCQE